MDQKKKILIVDDDHAILMLLQRTLESEGFEIMRSYSGADALKKIPGFKPDLVLSDFRMPGMDGLELLGELNKLSPRPLFILMTAYGSEEMVIDAFGKGADAYLKKPFEMDEVVEVVKKQFSNKDVGTKEAKAQVAEIDKTLKITQGHINFFKALGDRTRLRILEILYNAGEMNVDSLTQHFDMSQPTISHHLAILRKAKILKMDKRGKETFYSLDKPAIHEGYQQYFQNFEL